MKNAFNNLAGIDNPVIQAAAETFQQWGLDYARTQENIFFIEGGQRLAATAPIGVGHTRRARALAEKLFGSKDAALIIWGGNLSEQHEGSRFFGAAAGLPGFEDETNNAVGRIR